MEFTYPFDWELQKALMASWDAASDKMPDFKEAPLEPHCDSDRTPLPSKYFEAVANAFCDQHFKRDAESGIGLTLDIYGKQITDDPKQKRSPPEKPLEAYADDWKFHLTWKPRPDGQCSGVDENNLCKDAFYKLQTSQCGINHGSPVDRLYAEAKLDIGCGEIGWQATDKMPAKIGEQKCYKPYKHKDVKKDDQWGFVLDICHRGFDGEVVNKDYKGMRWSNPPGFSGSFMHVEISWVKDCTYFQDQKLDFPAEPDPYACPNILHDNFLNCKWTFLSFFPFSLTIFLELLRLQQAVRKSTWLISFIMNRQQRRRRRLEADWMPQVRVPCRGRGEGESRFAVVIRWWLVL